MSQKTFQRAAIALAVAGGLALPMFAQAQATPWMVRVHALSLDSANKDQTDLGLDLSVNNKVFPEFDVSYFFTPNIAAELVLTYPQKHDVRAGGTKIGSLKHLPPTLSLLGGYDRTYGSLAGVMITLIFFFLVGLGVVIGAELNAALAEFPEEAAQGSAPVREEKST